MYEGMSFEDIKRLELRRPLIPESTRRYAQDVIALFEQGLISRELAAKYLGEVSKEMDRIQGIMTPSDKIESIQINEATEVSAIDYEKIAKMEVSEEKLSNKERGIIDAQTG